MSSGDAQFRVAVITQVFNENVFLPIWLNHYGSIFGYDNLIVIDDGSDDNSLSDPRIKNLVKKKRFLLDETDRSLLISLFHESLLSHFDAIIYTDCDELIVLDPAANSNLYDYLKEKNWSILNVIGFHVLQHRAMEERLDFSGPLFHQRHFVMFDRGYCKPLLSKEPLRWRPGFHRSDKADCFDSNIVMFHLRSVDYEYSRSRIKVLNKIQFSSESLERQHGTQFRLSESSFLKMLYDDVQEGISKALEVDSRDVLMEWSKNPQFNKCVLRIPDRFAGAIHLNAEINSTPDRAGRRESALSHGPFESTEGGLQGIFERCFETMIFARERSRNSQCPCGSNQRYKHCHGALQR